MSYMNRNKAKARKEIIEALSLFSQIGITMAITLFISIITGVFIDRWLGTNPVFVLIFCFIGVLSAIRNLYVMTKNQWKK